MSTPHEYDFDKCLRMSAGVAASADVRAILLHEIPGAVNVVPASPINDRQGVDWWIEHCTARFLAVDAKVREEDWAASHPGEDDLALETFSVVEKGVEGWTRDYTKRCDYVLWLWKNSRRFCLVPFPMLCHVFCQKWEEWSRKYKKRRQRTMRPGCTCYHSECVFVPRHDVWAAMYREYGGGNLVLPAPSVTVEELPPFDPSTMRQRELW